MARRIEVFPDYTNREFTIGYISSYSNLVQVLAIVPTDKTHNEKDYKLAEFIAKALRRSKYAK